MCVHTRGSISSIYSVSACFCECVSLCVCVFICACILYLHVGVGGVLPPESPRELANNG